MSDPICPVCESYDAFAKSAQGQEALCKEIERKEALDELTAQAQEMGLYDNLESIRLKRLKELGLVGCLNDSGITSENYKEHIGAFPFGPIPHWEKLPQLEYTGPFPFDIDKYYLFYEKLFIMAKLEKVMPLNCNYYLYEWRFNNFSTAMFSCFKPTHILRDLEPPNE